MRILLSHRYHFHSINALSRFNENLKKNMKNIVLRRFAFRETRITSR